MDVTPSTEPWTGVAPAPTAAPEPGRRAGRLSLWPGLLALGLCLYRIGRPQLWRDEFASASAASRSFGQLFGLLDHVDASTGCYYLLLHVWTTLFGSSPAALRTPSALAMAGAAVLVTQIGARLYGRAAGLAGGLVFAVIPAVSRYGQEARAYALALFAVALATFLLLRVLERPSRGRWVGYAAAVVLVCVLHVVALSCLVGHVVAVWLHWRRHHDRRVPRWFAGSALAALALVSPLLLLAHSQVNNQLTWLARPNLARPQHVALDLWIDLYASRVGALIAALLVLLGVLLPLRLRRRRAATLFLVASGVLPVLAVILVSELGTSYFLGRYLLFTDIAWSVLAGAGLVGAVSAVAAKVRLPQGGGRFTVPVAAVAAVALGLLAVWPNQTGVRAYGSHEWTHYPSGANPGYFAYQGAADLLAKRARPGEGVVYLGYNPIMLNLGVPYYLGSRVALDQVFVARTPAQDESYYPDFCPSQAACLAKAPDRIWVVELAGDSGEPAAERAQKKLLHKRYRVSTEYHLALVNVSLLVRRA
ncbi:glycosyltransferase family 39 protein [Streptacidiphilus sp. P02-A3a]|uniref:glycosyltransferase family 39 protein n=1 Tax=Streptacidiphilus sp. P02-A3a TaxID=2704468 RepID=UPI0015F857D0|nr:glycosyltransferase family 39 protein [Streptacidiphilus sp. P02-A3a]QMU68309.1 hypothetical protein GXP74_08780 [Streptacidiphilus sp. P02-A3a]